MSRIYRALGVISGTSVETGGRTQLSPGAGATDPYPAVRSLLGCR